MTLRELVALLNSTGLPVAFSHFETPAPELPFIVYMTPQEGAKKADDENYYKWVDVDIELYTDKKDLDLEEQIEKLLDDNKLAYNATQTYIESERMFQKLYEVRLI